MHKPHRIFTPAEERFILDRYESMSVKDIAIQLNRQPNSVRAHMLKMGLPTQRKTFGDPVPPQLPMSEADIVLDWKQSADKPLQIRILADLNCTTQKKIKSILKKHGCEIPTKRAKATIRK